MLGDDTGCEAVMLRLTKFQRVRVLTLNRAILYTYTLDHICTVSDLRRSF